MLKFGKVAIRFTRFALVVPRRWACLVTVPSVPIAIVTWPEKPGTPLPESFSAVTSTAKGSEEHTSELQSQSNLVCRLLLEKKKKKNKMKKAFSSQHTQHASSIVPDDLALTHIAH